ncbi:MAG: hypothetical protein ABSB71_08315 [Candidatus Bathyarchaeia archaeon]|jgi:hypothetical protein
MKNKDVKKTVRKAYSKIATGSDSCCSCGCTGNDSQTTHGAPGYLKFPCPFASKLKKIIEKKVEIGSIDHTH